MIRKLASGEYRLYSRKPDARGGGATLGRFRPVKPPYKVFQETGPPTNSDGSTLPELDRTKRSDSHWSFSLCF